MRELPQPAPSSFEVAVLPDAVSLARAAAGEFARSAREAVADRGVFRVVLTGGSTPRATYRLLARGANGRGLSWDRVRFFWGDERCVPPDHESSNYRMARKTLLAALAIPPRRVFRIKGEADPAAAARAYEDIVRREFRGRPARFDLVMLGLGEDGHTASLFPGTGALRESGRLVVPNYVPRLDEWRVTMTYPAINAARRVIFLVSGREKSGPVEKILKKRRGWRVLPASAVSPRRGTLLWLLDEAAASKI